VKVEACETCADSTATTARMLEFVEAPPPRGTCPPSNWHCVVGVLELASSETESSENLPKGGGRCLTWRYSLQTCSTDQSLHLTKGSENSQIPRVQKRGSMGNKTVRITATGRGARNEGNRGSGGNANKPGRRLAATKLAVRICGGMCEAVDTSRARM